MRRPLAVKLDLGKIFNEARTIVGKIDDNTLQEFDRTLDQAKGFVGFDINTDFLQPLGDEWVVYRAPLSDAGMSYALVAKLRDPEKFAATLEKITTLFNERSGAPVKIEKVRAGPAEVSVISFLVYNVAWTVHNGNLYVSSMAGIPGAMAQVDDKQPSIAENDLYKNVMKIIPPGVKPTSLSYANPAKLYPEARNLVLGLIPLARAQGIDIPMDILPDPTQVAPFLTPGGMVGWSDDDGLHAMGTSAFPGSELLSGKLDGTTVVAAAGLGAAVALPAMATARVRAEQTVDMADARGIAMSAQLFAADNKDAMPDHLGRLLLDVGMSPKLLVSRRVGTPPLEMTPDLQALAKSDFPKFSAVVDAHCDFVYLGKDMKTSAPDAANIAILYQKPVAALQKGTVVAFMDGHCEMVAWGNVEHSLAPTVAYRAKSNLPPIDMDAIRKFDAAAGAHAAQVEDRLLP